MLWIKDVKGMLKKLIELSYRQFSQDIQLWIARRSSLCARYFPPGISLKIDHYMGQYTVEVNTSFQIERIMLSGTYEPTTISVLRRHIQQGATCVDIGANVGAIALALAQCVGKNGHIIAYEPGPSNFKKLQKNIQLNHGLLPKVDLYQLGLSNEVGNLFWYEDPSFPGNAGLREHQEEGDIVVPVTTLDTHLLPKIDRVDFIKIDVEGMEQQVLFGGENILKQLRPTIYFETLPETFDVVGEGYFLTIERFLTTLDYQLYRVSRFGHIQKTSILNTSANTLAIHKSKI